MHPKLGVRLYLRRMFAALLTPAVLSMVISTDAHAYVDPGSGALIWQALLAAFFGVAFYARSIIRQVKEWLSARKKHGNAAK